MSFANSRRRYQVLVRSTLRTMVVETLGVVCKRQASRSFPTQRLAILSIFILFMEYQRGRVTDSIVRDSHGCWIST
jgi:hypothetical protein